MFDLNKWDVSTFEVLHFDPTCTVAHQLVVAHVLWKSFTMIPSVMRNWWNECKNRQLHLSLANYVEKNLAPLIISKEIDQLTNADTTALEGISFKASKAAREVFAKYQIEENTLEIVIKLPTTYPLRNVEVENGPSGHTGVSESRWRGWILSVTAVMVSQNGSLFDALMLFKKNVGLHFDGVEDCAICKRLLFMLI
jgi:hypothetical protein